MKGTSHSSSGSTSISTEAKGSLLAAWEGVAAIDHHCHALRRWPFELRGDEFRSAFTEALDPRVAADHVPYGIAYRDAIHRVALELGCESTEAAVLERRNREEPEAYTRRLLTASGTGMMLVDLGYAGPETFSLAGQQAATGIQQREVLRLETLAESLVSSSLSPREWFGAVRAGLREAIGRGAVAVKTICAYRASLRIQPVDTGRLAVAFDNLRLKARAGERPRLEGNAACHALLLEAAAECCSLDVPLQVHCGFGDPDEDLAEASPLGLRGLLRDPAYSGLRVTLLHCYPYHREAAYLCSVFPDVYMDLSLTFPMAGLDAHRALGETLGLCPLSKLLYATDATRYPEVYLVAANQYREALADQLAELIDRRIMTADDAIAAGHMVLVENARRVYRLAG